MIIFKTDKSRIEAFPVVDGCTLFINDINEKELLPSHDEETKEKHEKGELLLVNICIEGRCELSMSDGTEIYLIGGEVAVDCGYSNQNRFFYPSGQYHGIEFVIDIDRVRADRYFNPNELVKRIKEADRVLFARANETVKALCRDIFYCDKSEIGENAFFLRALLEFELTGRLLIYG